MAGMDGDTRTGDDGTGIAYGRGRSKHLGTDIARLAGGLARVMLVTDPGIRRAGIAAGLAGNLAADGCEVTEYAAIAAEPTADDVDAAIGVAREAQVDAVVALGGGSVIDVAKLVGALAVEGEDIAAYELGAQPMPARPLPVIAVPTTAGTGAEVTRTCIFSGPTGAKAWAWSETLRPDLAVLDPELTVSLPGDITVATGVDALVHAMEAATSRSAGPGSALPAMQAMGLVRRHLPRAAADPGDLEARGGMLLAACLAGRAIDIAGTGVAHALGHALGSLAGVPHGRAVALGLDAAIAWNAEAAPEDYAAIAESFGVRRRDGASDAAVAHELAQSYSRFLRRLDLPVSLADAGLDADDAERLAEATMCPENATMLDANCRQVGETDALHLSRRLLAAE